MEQIKINIEGEKDMTEKYNQSAERLLEKLAFHYPDKTQLKNVIDLKKSFPIDQATEKFPKIEELIDEVQNEFNFGMSEFQCSWAIVMWCLHTLEDYNLHNRTTLAARA
jgi:hypothetical protein